MRRFRFEAVLAGLFLAVFAAVWVWQSPGGFRSPLSAEETNAYLGTIERNLPAHEENAALLARLRAWCEADDGRPFFMLNVMRYYDELRPDVALPEAQSSPREANAYYEQRTTPLVLAAGGHPIFMGKVRGKNLVSGDPALDDWDRVVMVRYPSLRHFLDLLSDPTYGPLEPYKMAALNALLIPVSADLLVPEPRLIAGVFLAVVFLGIAWLRR